MSKVATRNKKANIRQALAENYLQKKRKQIDLTVCKTLEEVQVYLQNSFFSSTREFVRDKPVIIMCDGSFCFALQNQPAFAAWCAYDTRGEITNWYSKVPADSPIESELWAIVFALKWALEENINDVRIFSDNKAAVLKLMGKKSHGKYFAHCGVAKNFFTKIDKVKIKWIHYRHNKKAHRLCCKAKQAWITNSMNS
ncbi:MAG: ribonuclease H-like domain-containing protein [Clostridiales bacterium]|nr:ribonuclease H-like domain-containing protein [Clostridiales bacterium]MCF8023291.1 ribonuclease H-like domain-containing protein [Clostridiales bacterium]